MSQILDTLRMIAPEFTDIGDSDVEEWIELCSPLVSRKRFGSLYAQALAYLTAHRMKLCDVGKNIEDDPLKDVNDISLGGLMRVGSYSEGGTSVSFSSSASQYTAPDAELALTPYGLQYLNLRRMRVLPIISAGEA